MSIGGYNSKRVVWTNYTYELSSFSLDYWIRLKMVYEMYPSIPSSTSHFFLVTVVSLKLYFWMIRLWCWLQISWLPSFIKVLSYSPSAGSIMLVSSLDLDPYMAASFCPLVIYGRFWHCTLKAKELYVTGHLTFFIYKI